MKAYFKVKSYWGDRFVQALINFKARQLGLDRFSVRMGFTGNDFLNEEITVLILKD